MTLLSGDPASEELVREAHAYRALLQNLSGMAYRCRNDPHWTMELVSEGCLAITGYPAEDLYNNSKVTFGDLILPEDQGWLWEKCQRNLEARIPCSNEYRIRTASGEVRWIWDQAVGVYAANGELLAIEGLITDIDPRKQAEEAKRRSEESFRELLDHSMQGTLVIQADRIVYANDAARRFLGRSDQELLRNPAALVEWLHPDDRAAALERQRRRMRGEPVDETYEVRMLRPDGDYRSAVTTNRALTIQGQPAVVAMLIDVTDLKRTETALRLSEQKARAVFDQTFEFIGLLDPAGTVLDANDAALKFAGASLQDVLGKPFWDTPWWTHSASEQQRLRQAIQDVGSSGFERFETTHRAPDGALHNIDFSLKAVRDARGTLLWLVPEGRDVTERQQALDRERVLETRLRAEHKLATVGTLAAGIAHDFNNILGAIVTNLALAQDDVGPEHPALQSLTQISQAVERASHLVRQILATGGQRTAEVRRLDLRASLEEAVALLNATLPKNVKLVPSCSDDAPPVVADPTLIHQVLLNLGTNAWQALEGRPGRVTLRVESVVLSGAPEAAYADAPPGHYARITVEDTGSGIPAGVLERVFDPFFTTKENGRGTGLGLWVVHSIVKNLGGSISVKSEPGRGTTFEILLPATEESGSMGTVAPTLPSPRGGGQHLLLLDDEPAILNVTARMLVRHGYRVTTCSRVQDALAALRAAATAFDLLLTDSNMPDGSGLDVARQAHLRDPPLPVILTSGFVDDHLRNEAAAAHVSEVLPKPYKPAELFRSLHRWLESGRC